jgi:hypothetical protein
MFAGRFDQVHVADPTRGPWAARTEPTFDTDTT